MLRITQADLCALTQASSFTTLLGFWRSAETSDAPIAQYPNAKPLNPSDRWAHLT